ncbi:uncharacterized protein LOC143521224 isoform X1 [Brachyhypopomus gauderio]|uniref:uncharacterized protein LOC143521224 isoform X1 n=1 Tax=Brachyhypopomus gauderio TaxID=698409 RepID=UPI00404356F8
MAGPVYLRILVGGDSDARKLVLKSGIPDSVDDLIVEIKNIFGLKGQFRLQYKDVDFENEYMNLASTSEIKDRDTLKVIFLPCEDSTSIPGTPTSSSSIPLMSPSTSYSSVTPSRDVSPSRNAPSDDQDNLSDRSSADTVIVVQTPESRRSSWPQDFALPQFSSCAELQLQKANTEFINNGTLLTPPPKLRSDILEGMAEEIFRYTAYATDHQLEEAAEALVKTHPCLRERGTRTGHEGWKHYLKITMANFRTKLSRIGHPEVSVNSLKNKRKGEGKAAANIKKPRKAEVNFLPCLPKGETTESLEKERVTLLNEVKKKNNEAVIREKMHQTFSYRRQEVVQDSPLVSDFQNRWPALFTVSEVNAEFMRITTLPLQTKFLGQLDKYTDNLIKIFSNRGGAAGKMIRLIMAPTAKCNNIRVRRDCVLKSLCVYLNKKVDSLVKEYLNCNSEDTKRETAQTVMGLYVIRKEGADAVEEPEDVGVIIEGTALLCNMGSISFGCAILLGLIYSLNLSYPPEHKFTFEFFQKVLMNLDGKKLSPKVQALKIKMLQ